MRVFKSAWFVRFARKESISDRQLQEAVRRADLGHVDADLGSGVVKQRIVREGQGRSGGYRAIILYREDGVAFFVYGYAKSRRAGIRPDETEQFKRMARHVLTLSGAQLDALIADGRFEEVADYDETVPE
jgi:hypothetical protein